MVVFLAVPTYYLVALGVTAVANCGLIYYLYNEAQNNLSSQRSSGSNKSNQPNRERRRSTNQHNTRNNARSSDGFEDNSGGAGAPNQPNNNRQNARSCEGIEDNPIYRELLNALENVAGGIYTAILKSLNDTQKQNLIDLLKSIIVLKGYKIKDVMILVIKLFEELSDHVVINFPNFLSLTEYIMVYIQEQKNRLMCIDAKKGIFKAREPSSIIQSILNNTEANCGITDLKSIFYRLKNQIEGILYYPEFRDIVCAIYHYYKHRNVPKYERKTLKLCEFTVDEYFELIKSLPFTGWNIKNVKRCTLIFEKYDDKYERTLRIVINVFNGIAVLSSCFFVSHNKKNEKITDHDWDYDLKSGWRWRYGPK